MLKLHVTAARVAACAALLVVAVLGSQVTVSLAAQADTYAMPQVVAQVPTPTPFRFLTPTPIVPSTTTTAPTTRPTAVPRAGGFPVEQALPILAGGLAALGGGTFLFRRKSSH